jgi:FkbM family methyltransferase
MKIIILIFKLFRPLIRLFYPDRQTRLSRAIRSYDRLPDSIKNKIGYSAMQYPLALFALLVDNVFFIQIGANDGQHADPLHRHIIANHWAGILVEPVPELFNRLNDTYADHDNLVFIKAAITERDGLTTFYRTKTSTGDNQYESEGLGTLDRDVLTKTTRHSELLSQSIIEEQVKGISVDTLLKTNNIERLDLIQIDTEGYDYKILKQFDLALHKPLLIIYEHKHLRDVENSACREYLQSHGYHLRSNQSDTLAYRQ